MDTVALGNYKLRTWKDFHVVAPPLTVYAMKAQKCFGDNVEEQSPRVLVGVACNKVPRITLPPPTAIQAYSLQSVREESRIEVKCCWSLASGLRCFWVDEESSLLPAWLAASTARAILTTERQQFDSRAGSELMRKNCIADFDIIKS